MNPVLLLAPLVLLGMAGGRRDDDADEGSSSQEGGGGSQATGPASSVGAQHIRDVARDMGLPADWGDFLVVVAHHESRWKNLVALGEPGWSEVPADVKLNTLTSEAEAGARNYSRNIQHYGACVWSKARYAYSGGWFGFLPSIGLKPWWNTQDACMDPWSVFDPEISVIMAVDYAVRNMRNYHSAFVGGGGNWRALNRSWAAPSWMDNPEITTAKGTEKRFDRGVAAAGLPSSWGNQTPPNIPNWSARAALARVRGGANA